MAKKNMNGSKKKLGKMFVITSLTATLVAAVVLFILAILLEKLGLSEEYVRIGIYITYLISAMSAGVLAGKLQKEKKFMWGALAGSIWFLIVFVISLCMNRMSIDVRGLFPAIVCMIGGGMLGGMLA